MKSKLLVVVGLFGVVILLGGCADEIRDIPPGYIGKILTPTGWEQAEPRAAGQVNIGTRSQNGTGNQLVLCESTSTTIKEPFGPANPQDPDPNYRVDHRVLTQNGVPVSVDIYVQVGVINDKKWIDSIFAQITPTPDQTQGRLSWISLQTVYDRLARPIIRGKTRQIFAGYDNYESVMAHYEQINARIGGMVASTFKDSKVPLMLVAVQLSNIKADDAIWAALNRKAAAQAEADAANIIGKAMRDNPGYLQKYKWDKLVEIKGAGTTVIVNDGGATGTSVPVGR
jgi:regulator of protease activity HflC (stomatin/prohibitin superfamily)